MRINKFLASKGVCSRREADRAIAAGRVLLNKKTAQMGDQVSDGDQVSFDGKKIRHKAVKPEYLLYHKPVGVICTTDKKADNNIIDALNFHKRVVPVGRLDVRSSGLIILTNDGGAVNQILRPEHKKEKEYEVTVDKPVTDQFLRSMREGIDLEGRVTLPAQVQRIGRNAFTITLVQGLNRQIRRMCEAHGYEVRKLHRFRIGNIMQDGLRVGQYRRLSKDEVRDLVK
jgi:23S rRNA pseudouridine2604 synthase